MYQKLTEVTLKTGERVDLGVVTGPETGELGEQLRLLLGHKGAIWKWQIEQSLASRQGEVESRLYILLKADRPFANIMLVERKGIGVFTHVYTAPAERRKGAADIIHACQMEDFKRRGGRALYLQTGFNTHPYHLYAKHGFRGVEPGSGCMFWFASGQEEFERAAFASSPTRLEPLSFQHWPTLPALAMMRHPARIRIAGMLALNVNTSEEGSLPYIQAASEGKQSLRAWLAVSEKSALPVALAALRPEHYFGGQVDLVDLFCAPGFEDQLPLLFEKLSTLRTRRAICYADLLWPAKAAVLRRCGFERTAILKRHLLSLGQALDVELWSK